MKWIVGCLILTLATNVGGQQAGAAFFRLVSPVGTRIIGFSADGMLTWETDEVGVMCTVQRAASLKGASNWVDYVESMAKATVTSLRIVDPQPLSGMVYIPAGSFWMGDSLGDGQAGIGESGVWYWREGWWGEVPTHSVSVSAYYMDATEVTWAMWCDVRNWAANNGYDLSGVGAARGNAHPVYNVNWYDVVKWCNARSQKEGRTPCYTLRGGVYKTGESDSIACNWSANGYRLPTEAEWEKAARGGPVGKRFPQDDKISHEFANFYALPVLVDYDTSETIGNHPAYFVQGETSTSPVGVFAANGYGLYDMAGNLSEWCWDWIDSYTSDSATDPIGPDWSSSWGYYRVTRGGAWTGFTWDVRVAHREKTYPGYRYILYGFRTVCRQNN